MSWTKTELKRSYPCNTELLKYLREQRNWSQKKLAQVAGYSERLISKVESGGSVAVTTIEVLAKALSTGTEMIYPEDLISNPVNLAKSYIQALHIQQQKILDDLQRYVDDDAVFHFSGDPDVVPFAGAHRGIAAIARAIKVFFDVLEVPDGCLDMNSYRYFAEGNDVVVWGESWVHPIGRPMDQPMPVTQRIRFRRGKIFRLEDRFDSNLAAEVLAQRYGS